MKRIYKYPVQVIDAQTLELPEGAKILHAGVQRGEVCLWALIDPDAKKQPRLIRIVGTGNPFTDHERLTHIGTVEQGVYIWHIFEVDP